MILRFATALALVLGAGMLLGYLHIMGRLPFSEPAARHLRAMKERRDAPAAVSPATLEFFEALPHRAPAESVATLERRGVVFEGYVQRMLVAADGDVHLELVAEPRADARFDTTYVTAEITPAWRRGSRTWRYEPLVAAFRPRHGGRATWAAPPRRVRVSGWLLYDWQYDAPAPRDSLAHGLRSTGWEIHPVTGIALADELHGGFVELRP